MGHASRGKGIGHLALGIAYTLRLVGIARWCPAGEGGTGDSGTKLHGVASRSPAWLRFARNDRAMLEIELVALGHNECAMVD